MTADRVPSEAQAKVLEALRDEGPWECYRIFHELLSRRWTYDTTMKYLRECHQRGWLLRLDRRPITYVLDLAGREALARYREANP